MKQLRDGRERSVVVFSCKGDPSHEQKFCNETARGDDGSLVVRAAPDGIDELFDLEDAEPIFEDVYPIEKVNAFVSLKNLHVGMLLAKASKGMPLMLTHSLNGVSDDSSHVRFLVAPVNDSD